MNKYALRWAVGFEFQMYLYVSSLGLHLKFKTFILLWLLQNISYARLPSNYASLWKVISVPLLQWPSPSVWCKAEMCNSPSRPFLPVPLLYLNKWCIYLYCVITYYLYLLPIFTYSKCLWSIFVPWLRWSQDKSFPVLSQADLVPYPHSFFSIAKTFLRLPWACRLL